MNKKISKNNVRNKFAKVNIIKLVNKLKKFYLKIKQVITIIFSSFFENIIVFEQAFRNKSQ